MSVIAVSIIYSGVHCSIKLIDETADQTERESISMQDAMLFPLQIGAAL